MITKEETELIDRVALRREKSAIVCDTMLKIIEALRTVFPKKNEWPVAFRIKVNDHHGGAPLTPTELERLLRVPRTTVRDALAGLVEMGVIMKQGPGYVIDPAYLEKTVDADYFDTLVKAILDGCLELRRLTHSWEGCMVDLIPTAAWLARPDGYIEYVNKRWLATTGVSAEQALGWKWTALIHPDDLPPLLETWSKVRASEMPGEDIVRKTLLESR